MPKERGKLWKDLNKSIYTGKRLEANLKGITAVSILSVVLGIVMLIINIVQHRSIPIISTSFWPEPFRQ